MLEITERILALMDRPDLRPVILNTARAEILAQHLSAARARRELDWSPRYGLGQGLTETIAWYRHYLAKH